MRVRLEENEYLIEWQDRDSKTIFVHRRDVLYDCDFDYDYVVFLEMNHRLNKKENFCGNIKPFFLMLNARNNDIVENFYI